ncbi:hypothetical protein [Clostridium sp. HBUAS56017]|uniref:hypothetical protein n=1 Tax=Clostridium sp. HBUAS56017 TaxID=2571128 RepID=UPI0011782E4B|nr:hypothetical protein [Clostridium sp. HBUAS56017]
MERKNRVGLVTLSVFIFTMFISAIGYYVFAKEGSGDIREPLFDVVASEKGNYSPGKEIPVKCKIDISSFKTDEEEVSFSDMEFFLSNKNVVSDRNVNLDNLAPGTIIYLEGKSEKINDYTQKIIDGYFKKTTIEFCLYFQVNKLPKDADGKELNVIIDDSLLKNSFITCNNRKIYFKELSQTSSINVNVAGESSNNVIPAISATCKNAKPNPSILNEKVNVTYEINAENFSYPNIIDGGTDTIILVDNSNSNSGGENQSVIKNELWNKLSGQNNLRIGKDKFGIVSFSDSVVGYKTVPDNLRNEDKIPGRQDDEVEKELASYLTDYYTQYNDRTLKGCSGMFSDPECNGLTWNGGNGKKIVEGFKKVKEIFDEKDRRDLAKGLKPTIKNVVLIVSGNLNYPEDKTKPYQITEEQVKEIRGYNYNVYTLQMNPRETSKDDLSVERFHKSIGGLEGDFYRNEKYINESHNFLMDFVAKSIVKGKPKAYEFKNFTLTFDLGDSFGKTSGKPISDRIIEKNMDNIKLVSVRDENDVYKPYWYVKNDKGEYVLLEDGASKEKLQVNFDVYPKEIGDDLNFKKNGSYVHYNDVQGNPVKHLISDPHIRVIDPATPRYHGLDNGTSGDSIIIKSDDTNIASGTNATILTYANVYAKDVKLELILDSKLNFIGQDANLYIYRKGEYIDKLTVPCIDEVQSDGKSIKKLIINNMPDSWQRGDIVLLKYMVRVPKDSEEGDKYINTAIYSRVVEGLEEKTFKGNQLFTIISAEPPNLF